MLASDKAPFLTEAIFHGPVVLTHIPFEPCVLVSIPHHPLHLLKGDAILPCEHLHLSMPVDGSDMSDDAFSTAERNYGLPMGGKTLCHSVHRNVSKICLANAGSSVTWLMQITTVLPFFSEQRA